MSPGLDAGEQGAHAWPTLRSRAGSLLWPRGQARHVGSALPDSGPLVGGSPLQRVGKFSVTFY